MVPKDGERVEAYGTVDELNSSIGVLLAVPGLPANVITCLLEIQHELFDMGGELCIPGHYVIKAEHVERLESVLDSFNDELPPLKEFICRVAALRRRLVTCRVRLRAVQSDGC